MSDELDMIPSLNILEGSVKLELFNWCCFAGFLILLFLRKNMLSWHFRVLIFCSICLSRIFNSLLGVKGWRYKVLFVWAQCTAHRQFQWLLTYIIVTLFVFLPGFFTIYHSKRGFCLSGCLTIFCHDRQRLAGVLSEIIITFFFCECSIQNVFQQF